MESIRTRWATYKDAQELGIVHSEGWKVAYKNIIPDEVLDNITVAKRSKYFEEALKGKRKEAGVLIVDDKVVGFLALGVNRDDDLDDSYGEIWGIYLLPEYWGKGLGKVLFKWSIQELVKEGYKKITLWVLEENIRARRFYEKLGFIHDGVVKEIQIGKLLNEVRYIKYLGG